MMFRITCARLHFMRILIATPLYPPDTGEPAQYAKELARRLSALHDITIITYGNLPEKLPGVTIITLDKQHTRWRRVFQFTRAFSTTAKNSDVLLVEKGPSTELPALIISFFMKPKIILHHGDPRANTLEAKHPLYRLVATMLKKRAQVIINDSPNKKPEILPFAPYPTKEIETYEHSWNEHLTLLKKEIDHA